MMQERESYREKMQTRLDKMEEDIQSLQGQLSKVGEDTRFELEEQLNALRAQQSAARQRLAAMKHSGNQAWADLKEGMENAWHELETAFENASDRFNTTIA